MIDAAWRMTTDRRTYLRILYLLLAFPLGTLYFVVIVTGLSTGLSLAIVMVGFPILVLTVLAWLLFARIERELAIHLLGADVRPMWIADPTKRSPWDKLLKVLGDSVTWKSLAYLLIEFPFGVFSFTLTILLVTLSLSLLLYPVAYIVANLLNQQFPNDVNGTMWPGVAIDGRIDTSVVVGFLPISALGVGFGVATLGLLSGMGWSWSRLAEMMLGIDSSRLQLESAQAEAVAQQTRAERAEQSRRQLVVNASHELRTPVASISAHVESLLKPDREIDDEARRYLSVIAAETDRLSALVDDVLLVARADAGELHVQLEATDVPAVVQELCEVMAPLARHERNLSLVYSRPKGSLHAIADRDRLAQVLSNLIRNSVNHTPEGGIISIDTSLVGDRVVIAVSDTGVGIPPQEIDRIFDRFYRIDEARGRDRGGSGLGLAIARDLIAAMGGSITAESTPGRGSVFRVSLAREVN